MAERQQLQDDDDALSRIGHYSDISSNRGNSITIQDVMQMYQAQRDRVIKQQELIIKIQDSAEKDVEQKKKADKMTEENKKSFIDLLKSLNDSKNKYQALCERKRKLEAKYHEAMVDCVNVRLQIAACPIHGVHGKNIYGQANNNDNNHNNHNNNDDNANDDNENE